MSTSCTVRGLYNNQYITRYFVRFDVSNCEKDNIFENIERLCLTVKINTAFE